MLYGQTGGAESPGSEWVATVHRLLLLKGVAMLLTAQMAPCANSSAGVGKISLVDMVVLLLLLFLACCTHRTYLRLAGGGEVQQPWLDTCAHPDGRTATVSPCVVVLIRLHTTYLMPDMSTSALPILAMAVLPITYSCREYKSSSIPPAPSPAASLPLLLLLSRTSSPFIPSFATPEALLAGPLHPPRSPRHARVGRDKPSVGSSVDVGRTRCPVTAAAFTDPSGFRLAATAGLRPCAAHTAAALAVLLCKAANSNKRLMCALHSSVGSAEKDGCCSCAVATQAGNGGARPPV